MRGLLNSNWRIDSDEPFFFIFSPSQQSFDSSFLARVFFAIQNSFNEPLLRIYGLSLQYLKGLYRKIKDTQNVRLDATYTYMNGTL